MYLLVPLSSVPQASS